MGGGNEGIEGNGRANEGMREWEEASVNDSFHVHNFNNNYHK